MTEEIPKMFGYVCKKTRSLRLLLWDTRYSNYETTQNYTPVEVPRIFEAGRVLEKVPPPEMRRL